MYRLYVRASTSIGIADGKQPETATRTSKPSRFRLHDLSQFLNLLEFSGSGTRVDTIVSCGDTPSIHLYRSIYDIVSLRLFLRRK